MLLKIFAPIIFIFGLVGNAINLYVFTRPPLRGLSTFRFLVYLSLIDFLFILIGIPHIISITYLNFDFRDYSNVLCSLHTFFTIFLSHLSSNVLAVVGVVRCVTINTLKPMNNAKSNTLNLRKQHKHASKPSRRHTGPGNPAADNSNKIKIVKSSNARISSKFFIISFFSEFGSADLITISTCAILFLFDFHYLIWMRLTDFGGQDPSEGSVQNITSNFTAETTSWNNRNSTSSFDKSRKNISSYSLISPASSASGGKLQQDSEQQILPVQDFVAAAAHTLKCYPSPSNNYYFFYTKIWVWIDLFLYSYIPFVVMLICTILIIFRLVNINKNLTSHSKKSVSSSLMVKAATANDAACKNNHSTTGGSGTTSNRPAAANQLNRTASETRSLIEIKIEGSASGTDQQPAASAQELVEMNASQHSKLSESCTAKTFNIQIQASPKTQTRLCIVVSSNNGNEQPSSQSQSNNLNDRTNKRRTKKNNQIYKLLLTLNIFFFVLVSPLVTANTLGYLNQDHELIGQICYILAYLNHCLNFLFYGLSCGVYRQILIEKFTRVFRTNAYCHESTTKPSQSGPAMRAL